MSKNLYIFAGCNGAGKTTAAFCILPHALGCMEFVNADEIARGLSPFAPQNAAIEAGRIMLQRVEYMLREQKTFALETTLASKSIKNIIHTAHNNGYHAGLLFFYLESVELAKLRVQQRVLAGGHNIEEHVIHRRYHSGIRNLFDIYMPLCNTILIVNNSLLKPRLIACKENGSMRICNEEDFHKIKQYYEQQCQP